MKEIPRRDDYEMIIGIFDNIEKANNAEGSYIEYYKKNDSLREQYVDVNFNEDIIVKEASNMVEFDHKIVAQTELLSLYFF